MILACDKRSAASGVAEVASTFRRGAGQKSEKEKLVPPSVDNASAQDEKRSPRYPICLSEARGAPSELWISGAFKRFSDARVAVSREWLFFGSDFCPAPSGRRRNEGACLTVHPKNGRMYTLPALLAPVRYFFGGNLQSSTWIPFRRPTANT